MIDRDTSQDWRTIPPIEIPPVITPAPETSGFWLILLVVACILFPPFLLPLLVWSGFQPDPLWDPGVQDVRLV